MTLVLLSEKSKKQLAKLHGEARIKQELRKKGLDSLLIAQSLEDLDVDWFELCLKAKVKKIWLEQTERGKRKSPDGSLLAVSRSSNGRHS
nr:RecX family transcriptional regulator [Vibrio parahaemolyticus]